MTETDSLTQTATNNAKPRIDPSTAEGRGRLFLMGGMGWLAIGHFVDMGLVVWGGVAIICGAFALNTAGKLTHYHELPISRDDEVKLALSWTLLAITIVGLLTTYAYARYGPGNGAHFWTFAVAGTGFGLLHMAAQSKYIPADEDDSSQ